jgi:hypothetical protein
LEEQLSKTEGFCLTDQQYSNLQFLPNGLSACLLPPACFILPDWALDLAYKTKLRKMKKNPLQGLGKKLNLHILIPVIYFGVMIVALIVKLWG